MSAAQSTHASRLTLISERGLLSKTLSGKFESCRFWLRLLRPDSEINVPLMIQLLQIDESFEFSEALGSHELPHLKDPVDCCFLERSKSPSLRRNILLPNLPWCTFLLLAGSPEKCRLRRLPWGHRSRVCQKGRGDMMSGANFVVLLPPSPDSRNSIETNQRGLPVCI